MSAPDAREQYKEAYRRQCNELARRYIVRDIIPDSAQFVFLLESPHIQELKHGAPVSGSSGSSMSRHLFGEAYARMPLGIIVKKNVDERLRRPSLDRIGLMNSCNIPMQQTAYGDPAVHSQYAELLGILEKLRSANDRTAHSDQTLGIVQEIIAGSLRRRLQNLAGRTLYMIPCGRLAQKFFKLADVSSEHWQVIHGVPHPSYNNWSKPDYAPVIERLTAAFRER